MSNNRYKILLVEDDKSIRNLVSTLLTADGYQALTAQSCAMGLTMYESYIPDLVLLDLGLPDKDGLHFIRQVRNFSTVPIVVLSARNAETDKVEALDAGANDYIAKPFGNAELLARIRAALRNQRVHTSPSTQSSCFTLKDLTIDYDRRRVFIGADEVHLTQTEYNILSYLSLHLGKVMTYSAIMKAVWGMSDDGNVKKLQVNMANIRKKLGVQPGQKNYILNELGVGYRMNDDEW